MNLRAAHARRDVVGAARRAAPWLRRLTTVAVLATAATGSAALASTASAAALLPDLVADAPGPGLKPEIYDDGTGQRLLIRMNGYVHNRGSGALEIRGSGPSGGLMTSVQQRVYDSAGGFSDLDSAARLWFETTDGHNHWHLMNAMRYSLWSADRSYEVAPSQKVGFCLIDSQRIEGNGPLRGVYPVPGGNFCGQAEPNRAQLVMGVSPGWRDIYGSPLPFQWVDVSNTAPGSYWLRADADPTSVIQESDEANVGTYATAPSVVNGYLAQPVDAGTVSANAPSAIDLQAKEFDDPFPGSPGAVEFEIVTPPSSGSLDQPTGEWFSGSLVHYTPAPGQSGPVAFTFAARDSASAFPRNPPGASVTASVAGLPGPGPGPSGARLAISGAPESVQTSSVTRLTATGPEAFDGVAWSADGNVGGSRQFGTLSLDGVYTAPASPPRGGVVRIGAKSISGATATAPIRIVQAPAAKAAPSSALIPAAHGRLSKLVLARQRRTLIAIVVPGRRGRLSFVARRGGQRIASCSMAAEAHVRSTCSMKLSRKIAPDPFICKVPKTKGLKLPGVTVTATLSYGGRPRVTRWAKTR